MTNLIDKRKRFPSLALCVFLALFGVAYFQLDALAAPGAGLKKIQLSFKRDPRMVDPFRGVGEWVTGSDYAGAAAQDTVQARAEGVDAAGRSTKIDPQWTASDPEMVTISPSQGADVKITVHKDGESRLKVSYRGLSKELLVTAQYVNNLMVFELAPADGPTAPVAQLDPLLNTQKAQLSYAAGMRLAKTLKAQSREVDPDLVARAVKDVLAGGPTLLTDEQVALTLMGVESALNVTEATLERKKLAEKYRKQGEQFLAENAKNEGVVTLPDGLQYRVIKAGDGRKATSKEDVAVCQYKGSLIDGTVFDDSHKHKDGGPVHFPLKAVIKGWQEALKQMPAGSEWQIFVPPELAYGERGAPQARIPPNATLVFDVELLAVRAPGEAEPQKAALPPEQLEAVKKLIQAQKIEGSETEKNQ